MLQPFSRGISRYAPAIRLWIMPFIFLLVMLLATVAPASAASSKTYYFKYFPTSGSISPWYTNDNSWGVNAPNGTGFVAMVSGEDWGTSVPGACDPQKT